MNASAEAQRLRIADGLARDAATPGDSSDPQGAPTLLCQTATVTTYPTTASAFYAVQTVDLVGSEAEGSSGVTAARSGTFFAYNLGSRVPLAGTLVMVTFVPYRWVFRYD